MNLVIFDDFVVDKDQSKIANYFIQIRKQNASIIFISHRWHAIDQTIREQLSDVILFQQSKKEINKITQDFGEDMDKDDFKKLLIESTKNPHDFLYIAKRHSDKPLKYRKNMINISLWNDIVPSRQIQRKRNIKCGDDLDYLNK